MQRTRVLIVAAACALSAAPGCADQVGTIIQLNDGAQEPGGFPPPPDPQAPEAGNGAVIQNDPTAAPQTPPAEGTVITVPQTAEEGEKAPPPTPQEINTASFTGQPLADGQSALTATVQILLDRGGVSPGVIDGYNGDNVSKAIRAFEEINKMPVDGLLDDNVWAALLAHGGGDLVKPYTITPEDISDIVAPLPDDYSELAERDWLGYTTAQEKLAERFHLDEDFLVELNPGADFSVAGTQIWVPDTGEEINPQITRIYADKSLSRLLAYDADGFLVLSYPVTIGSSSTPSPSGVHEVLGVAMEPTYSYDPENFVQGDNTEKLTLPPGPNGPVGIVWIDLSEPSYGIHGTPAPDAIGKTSSHGCIRLTNWDATELAHAVKPGVQVEFTE